MQTPVSLKVGLEIHIYPKTGCKMFCRCSASFLDAPPNTNICPVCTGQPGSKPMPPNLSALTAALQISDIFGMSLSPYPVVTLRKHYFYPDLPSNYQRTSGPVATGGRIGSCRLREIHFEEDPGQYDISKGKVDFNRSGVPLLELVTEPDIASAAEARRLLVDLLFALEYLEVSREEMPFKVDTNISLNGGRRVEIKNINSLNGVVKSVEYETERQLSVIESGGTVEQETRHFDPISGTTVSLRYKESVEDYRYLPDPDILPVDVSGLDYVRRENPFLILRKMTDHGVHEPDARTVVVDRNLLRLYEFLAARTDPKFASVFVARDVKSELNYRSLPSSFLPGIQEGILQIASNYSLSKLSNQNATLLLRALFDGSPIEEKLRDFTGNWFGPEHIAEAVAKVISENTEAAEKYRQGRKEVINFLVGQCMRRLHGKAKPEDVMSEIAKALDGIQR
jgi:aspartyl-tRNA(Asn)/glutamyl-tRNA(Gln) amidotransferase subunit B